MNQVAFPLSDCKLEEREKNQKHVSCSGRCGYEQKVKSAHTYSTPKTGGLILPSRLRTYQERHCLLESTVLNLLYSLAPKWGIFAYLVLSKY